MKFAYPVTTPECGGKVRAMMTGYDQAFAFLKACGYDGVELLIRSPDEVDCGLLDESLAKWGLKAAAFGTSPMQLQDGLFLLHPEPENRKEARRRFGGLVRLCARYRVPALMGKYRGMVRDADGCRREDLLSMLRDICGEAAEHGVRVLLEPQNASNINNFNTIGETADYIRRSGIENLGILADVYHMGITEAVMTESLRKAGELVDFVHMSDSGRNLPGRGSLPVREVLDTLRAMEYPGYVSLETDQEPDAETAAAQSITFMKNEKGSAEIPLQQDFHRHALK